MSDRKIFLASVVFLLLVAVAAIVIVIREGGFLTKAEKPIFISYVGLWDPEVINPLKVEFQRQNPNVTIEYEQKNQDLYFETLKNLLVQEKPPDIYWWHSGWGPMLKEDLATLPENIVSHKEYEKTYYPITEADAKIGGGYRGIPLGIDGLALIYNKKLLADKNLKKPPKTWSELERVYVPALNIHEKRKGIVRSAIALGTAKNVSNFSEIVGLMFLQNGVTFVKNGDIYIDKNVSIEGENLGQKALKFYSSFTPFIWDRSRPNSIRAFTKAEVAMIILPADKIPSLQSQIKATGNKVKFGVANVPQPPEVTPTTWGSYWLSGVSNQSPHQREAWQFIKFLGEPENLRVLFKKEKEFRKIGRPYPRVDMETELRSDPLLGPYVAQAKFAKSWYFHSGTGDGALNDEMITELGKIITRLSEGKGSLKNNLGGFAAKAREIATKYGVIDPVVVEK